MTGLPAVFCAINYCNKRGPGPSTIKSYNHHELLLFRDGIQQELIARGCDCTAVWDVSMNTLTSAAKITERAVEIGYMNSLEHTQKSIMYAFNHVHARSALSPSARARPSMLLSACNSERLGTNRTWG